MNLSRIHGTPVSKFVLSNLVLQGQTIIQVCCGADHYAIVCESGRVFTFGSNKHNQLGLTEVGSTVYEPTLVSVLGFVRVEQVACGRDFTLFLTAEGKLLGCGSNPDVHGANTPDSGPTPLKWSAEVPIKKISAGLGHVLALSTTGYVWSSGQNLTGQLGLNAATQPVLTQVDSRVFTDVSCGAYHSAVLHSDGTLHTAGWHGEGQLGQIPVAPNSPRPKTFQPVVLPTKVATVACGFDHTVAVGTDGTVWAWGGNRRGQLGVGDRTNCPLPKRVVGLEGHDLVKVVAGRTFTVLIARDGQALMCGGVGEEGEDLLVATPIGRYPLPVARRVDLALSHAMALMPARKGPGDAGALLSGLEKAVRACLECPVCFAPMAGPMRVCTAGHSLCEACACHVEACPQCREPFAAPRNVALEGLASLALLPCKECGNRAPVSGHGDACPTRPRECPSCDWRGLPEDLWSHSTSAHPDDTWQAPHMFVHANFEGLVETNVFTAHGQTFLLRRKYDPAAKVFRAAVQIWGAANMADEFRFRLDLISGDGGTNIGFSRNVCVDTNTVESVFQSSDAVSVKRQLLDMFLQDEKLVCEVNVLKTDCCDRADVITSLLGKCAS